MIFESERFVVVGGIPEPEGGVTTYIYRLARRDSGRVEKVFDLYQGSEKKDISPVEHVNPKRLPLLHLFLFLLGNREDVYFNFSGVLGLVVLVLLPKRPGVKWFLTLHNGAVGERLARSRLLHWLARVGAGYIDQMGFLSEEQKKAYYSLGLTEERLLRVSSFIPTDSRDIAPLDANRFPEVAWCLENEVPYFLISGYPTLIYQHQEVLQLFQSLWEEGLQARLFAFWYGDDSDGILEALKQAFQGCEKAHFYWGVDSDSFLSVMSSASGYIRMNTVDSFGVAVAEAVTADVPVIATNVCARYEGADVVDVGDFASLKAFVLRVSRHQGQG